MSVPSAAASLYAPGCLLEAVDCRSIVQAVSQRAKEEEAQVGWGSAGHAGQQLLRKGHRHISLQCRTKKENWRCDACRSWAAALVPEATPTADTSSADAPGPRSAPTAHGVHNMAAVTSRERVAATSAPASR